MAMRAGVRMSRVIVVTPCVFGLLAVVPQLLTTHGTKFVSRNVIGLVRIAILAEEEDLQN